MIQGVDKKYGEQIIYRKPVYVLDTILILLKQDISFITGYILKRNDKLFNKFKNDSKQSLS